jgi:uncharacterized iron-regulated membrane protein
MAAPTIRTPRGGQVRLLKLAAVRWLVIGHRWLGILTCLLCAMWFVSGLVMVYVPYPALTDRDRMLYAEPLSAGAVAVTPDQALAAAGLTSWPSLMKLDMLRGEPVWRIQDGVTRLALSAVDGRPIGPVSEADAVDAVRRLLPKRHVAEVRTLVRDQWTVAQGYDPHRPLRKVSLAGDDGLVLYVSSTTGEVVGDTNRIERAWNWVGSIPHWIYPTALRKDNAAWRQVIMWTSGPAVIAALAGAILGVIRLGLRPGRPLSPFRGWMKWHHWAGLTGGLFALAWLFSGWLSVNPFQWFPRRSAPDTALAAYASHAQPSFPATLDILRDLPLGEAREARLSWVGGRPLITLVGPGPSEQRIFAGDTGAPTQLSDAALFAAARALVPDAPIAAAERLERADAYWRPTHRTPRRLPVLRVKFADPRATWVHIDPLTGEVLGQMDQSRRTYRWLFNALHAWDLPVFQGSEPARQAFVWLFSVGGLVLSISGIVIGWRHLRLALGVRPGPL